MEIRVTQVTVKAGDTVGLIVGVPVNDETKVIVAGADWRAALALGAAITERGEEPIVDVPDWAILGILGAP